MRSRFFHTPYFHTHHSPLEKKPGWLELFYDLIYVAAFIQLGNAFAKDISFFNFVRCTAVFIPMWLIWVGYTYYSNRYTVDDFFHRIMVFLQMFCIGGMAISMPALFNGKPILFGSLYAISQFLVYLMYYRSIRQLEVGNDYSCFWGRVFLISSIIWACSLFLKDYYYIGWIIGMLVIFISPFKKRARILADKYPFDQEHLAERFGLLTIIVLGESFVKVLSEVSVINVSFMQIAQACFALLLTCSMWWIYFDDVAGTKLREGKFTSVIWFLTHLPLQIAIIFMGVGIKKAVIFGSAPPTHKYAILLSFSIGAALIATAIIDSVTHRRNNELGNNIRVNIRFFSGAMICLIGLISSTISGTLFLILCLFVCLFQIIFDTIFSPMELDEQMLDRTSVKLVDVQENKVKRNFLDIDPIRKRCPQRP